ncbi:hypothetical protein DFH08DRAFT_970884 [Mycena albidolilacea]|uniref:Uncharacterized protein n=1 Tax=Mycena albidolilacea TaxID=1033008 RepID=A0AAD6ZE33_9AGAR|nr:hypothetical protein DFH08DRAFT_970884 [Mycena albidolilacea]
MHYCGVEDLIPMHAELFKGTPVMNSVFLRHVKNRWCKYIRGNLVWLTSAGVLTNVCKHDTKPGSEGNKKTINAEVIILATGFKHPRIDFLDDLLFPEDYQHPVPQELFDGGLVDMLDRYIDLCNTGMVGHFHIGIYTRILLTLLLDTNTRLSPKDMKLWVDFVCQQWPLGQLNSE